VGELVIPSDVGVGVNSAVTLGSRVLVADSVVGVEVPVAEAVAVAVGVGVTVATSPLTTIST
jgi:hypothetical protein